MGLFSFLFSRPVILENDFFGRLTLESRGQHDSINCYYAEKVMFHPIGIEIECMIDANSSGPTAAQRDFFQRFEQIYASVLPEIIAIVESDYRLNTPIVNFASTHHLAGLTIPQLGTGPVEWEVWFEPIDKSHWGYSISIDMVDDVPQLGIGISA